MNFKTFVICLMIACFFPYAIAKIIPENIREARQIENAPRHTVTVSAKWTKFINPETDGYWIRFQEPVANTQELQITSGEWKALRPGGRITIVVLPDGRPHTLDSGGGVAFEQVMFVLSIVLWLGATIYIITVIRSWLRKRSRSGDPAVG
jgi:hypothetical protein